jgi:phosphopantothenoylcysteine decarboxylase/phosphopantothenate--cysteine ligase
MKVILAVGGGIAAYKSAELARLLMKRGDEVQVVMTAAAREFIQPLTFATLTGRRVITDLFEAQSYAEHIEAARQHDLLLIAPATAGILGKLANGLADDFLSTLYLAFTGEVVLAPSMNDNMWRHAATQRNLRVLEERGARVVQPGDGYLACGSVGPGRLAEPAEIVAALRPLNQDLSGETVLITAGPTQEPIDPVRYLSNRSSGKMGYALAAEAAGRGASVTLVSGPVALEVPAGVTRVSVRTAAEMYAQVLAHFERATVIVKCAAVADFRPAVAGQVKLKKAEASLTLALEPTVDILAELGRRKGGRLLVGFAAETGDARAEALRKAEAKNCDLVVGNCVGAQDGGFDRDSNSVVLVWRSGETRELALASKWEIARGIWDEIARMVREKHGRG